MSVKFEAMISLLRGLGGVALPVGNAEHHMQISMKRMHLYEWFTVMILHGISYRNILIAGSAAGFLAGLS